MQKAAVARGRKPVVTKRRVITTVKAAYEGGRVGNCDPF